MECDLNGLGWGRRESHLWGSVAGCSGLLFAGGAGFELLN